MRPKRIQLRRIKGWRKPDNTVVVSRPTKWGNGFNWKSVEPCFSDKEKRQFAVDDFEAWLNGSYDWIDQPKRKWILDHIHELRGKNLACWCPLDQPCHADILLKLANSEETE